MLTPPDTRHTMAQQACMATAAWTSPGGRWTRARDDDRGPHHRLNPTATHRPLRPPRASTSSSSPSSSATFVPDPTLAASIDAVTRACDLLLDIGSNVRSHTKDDDTPVTVADLACQALITQALRKSLGDDTVVIGEEDDAVCIVDNTTSAAVAAAVERHGGDGATAVDALAQRVCVDDEALDALSMRTRNGTRNRHTEASKTDPPYFVLDPIDGTKAFVRGIDDPRRPQCVVGLALVDPQTMAPTLGVMGLPYWRGEPLGPNEGIGIVVAASAGKGCWYKPLFSGDGDAGWRRTNVTQVSNVQDAIVVVSEHENLAELPIGLALSSRKFGGESQSPDSFRMGCGSLCKYAAVALNVAQVFVQHPPVDYALKGKRSHVWDHAAGMACCVEAGAAVTDLNGGAVKLGDGEYEVRAFEPGGGGILVAASGIHARCLELYTRGTSAGKS